MIKRKINFKFWIPRIILLSLIVPIFYLVIKIIIVGSYRSDLVLMLTQCILGIIAFFIPNVISKKLKLYIPSFLYMAYIIFLYASIVLGEIRQFYYTIPYWDSILHFTSGLGLGILGFSVIDLLNNKTEVVSLSPIFIALFSCSFAVFIGVLWEIYEFSFDGILSLNMQKYMLQDGTQLIGRGALGDTMKDLVIDTFGAFISSFVGYLAIKYKKHWMEDLIIKKDDKKRIS